MRLFLLLTLCLFGTYSEARLWKLEVQYPNRELKTFNLPAQTFVVPMIGAHCEVGPEHITDGTPRNTLTCIKRGVVTIIMTTCDGPYRYNMLSISNQGEEKFHLFNLICIQ